MAQSDSCPLAQFRRFRALLDAIPQPAILKDTEGRIALANAAAYLRRLGGPRFGMLGGSRGYAGAVLERAQIVAPQNETAWAARVVSGERGASLSLPGRAP